MRPENFLVGIIMLSFITFAGVMITTDINTNYNKTINQDPAFAETYAAINETMANTSVLSQQTRNKTLGADTSTEATTESVVRGSFGAIRLVGNSFGLLRSIVNGVATAIGIPTFFITLLMLVVTVLVIFGIIRIFMRVNQ